MGNKMVWDNETQKMVKVGASKGKSQKIALDVKLAEKLIEYAKEDGFDFSGISFVTAKDAEGKTKKDKDGKPVFVMVNGKPRQVTVEVSTAKVNSAIAQYVEVAVKALIASRG